MILSPVLQGLRRDPAPQLAAQAAMLAARDSWYAMPEVAPVLEELAVFGAGAPLASCPGLAKLLGDKSRAVPFAERFVAAQAHALAEHPLGHVAFRCQMKPGLAMVQIAEAGRANLCLLSYHSRGIPPAESVCFASGERYELCLKGRADIRRFTLDEADGPRALISCSPGSVGPGERIAITHHRQARTIDRAEAGLVMLRLAREDTDPGPSREYRIADSALLHVASGKRADSRDEMAMAVLGAMGRHDAVPTIATMARDTGSDHLRWQALRQTLALDSGAGFALLTDLARASGDPLAAPAGALRATLIERHPQLLDLTEPCPA